MRRLLIPLVAALTACGGPSGSEESPPSTEQMFPDVVGVEVSRQDDGRYRFSVTISSPYDTPDRYADAWRIQGEDGTVYGVRELLHDHAGEQPFTRSLSDVEIPEGVQQVIVEGRDQEHGWGGETLVVDLP